MHPLALPSLLALGLAPQQLDPPALAASTAKFARELYRALDDQPGNLLFSPHSIAQALAMARAGAAGDTAKAFDATLHWPDGGAGDAFRKLAETLRPPHSNALERDAYELSIATSMWGQSGYEYAPAFLETLKSGFGASFFDVDFAKPDPVREKINAWVAHATRDKIPELLPKGQPSTSARLMLVDALYLKAAWIEPFQAAATQPAPFHANGRDVQAPTMHLSKRLEYGETELARIVALPYHGGLEMRVVLPKANGGLKALAEREDFTVWTGQLTRRKVELAFPKFTFRSANDLSAPLGRIGLALAFDRARADFSRITTREKLCVQAVFHQAFIAVDEQGTEAAAATGISVGVTSMPREEEPVRFVVDHPFLFVVRHVASGEILFVGRVEDPTAG